MVRENIHSDGGGVTLRRKSILIVTGTAIALLAAMYVAGRATILAAALRLEKESVALDLSRLLGALETEADHLLSTVGTGPPGTTPTRSCGSAAPPTWRRPTDDALRNLHVTSMLFLDGSGAIVAESICPRGTSGGTPLGPRRRRSRRLQLHRGRQRRRGRRPRRAPAGGGEPDHRGAARPAQRRERPAGRAAALRAPLDIVTVARDVRVHHLEAALLPLADPRVPLPDPGQPPAGAAAPAVVRPRSFRVVSGFVPVADFRGRRRWPSSRPSGAPSTSRGFAASPISSPPSASRCSASPPSSRCCSSAWSFAALAPERERAGGRRAPRISRGGSRLPGGRDRRARRGGQRDARAAPGGAHGPPALARRARRARARAHLRVGDLERGAAGPGPRAHPRGGRAPRPEGGTGAPEPGAAHRRPDEGRAHRGCSHELRTPVAKQAMQLELLRGELARRGLLEELARPLAVMDTALRRRAA